MKVHKSVLSQNNKYDTKMNALISIIVPIYNKEKYLDRCIDSIINQSYSNVEIILIDDCSTDKSYEICKQFKNKDKRIVLVKNRKNHGISYSRNIGIKKSTGKYISFVDADDYIEKDMIKTLYYNLKYYKLDFCQISVGICGENKPIYFDNVSIITSKNEMLTNFFVGNISFCCWDKMYRRNVLSSFNDNYKKYEDGLFIFESILKSKKIGLCDIVLYNYEIDDSKSLTKNYYDHEEIAIFDTINYVEKNIKKYNRLKKNFDIYKINSLLFLYRQILSQNSIKKIVKNEYIMEETIKIKDYLSKTKIKYDGLIELDNMVSFIINEQNGCDSHEKKNI